MNNPSSLNAIMAAPSLPPLDSFQPVWNSSAPQRISDASISALDLSTGTVVSAAKRGMLFRLLRNRPQPLHAQLQRPLRPWIFFLWLLPRTGSFLGSHSLLPQPDLLLLLPLVHPLLVLLLDLRQLLHEARRVVLEQRPHLHQPRHVLG